MALSSLFKPVNRRLTQSTIFYATSSGGSQANVVHHAKLAQIRNKYSNKGFTDARHQSCRDKIDDIDGGVLIMYPLVASFVMLAYLSKKNADHADHAIKMEAITHPLFEYWCKENGKVASTEEEKLELLEIAVQTYPIILTG